MTHSPMGLGCFTFATRLGFTLSAMDARPAGRPSLNSMTRRSCLRELQGRHAGTRLPSWLVPPRMRGMTWSTVVARAEQYAHLRRRRFHRMSNARRLWWLSPTAARSLSTRRDFAVTATPRRARRTAPSTLPKQAIEQYFDARRLIGFPHTTHGGGVRRSSPPRRHSWHTMSGREVGPAHLSVPQIEQGRFAAMTLPGNAERPAPGDASRSLPRGSVGAVIRLYVTSCGTA